MSAKKNEQEAVENTVEEAVENTKDPKANYVEIFIPRKDKDDLQRLFSINFKDYMVQTNKRVLVPPEVAEVYQNSIAEEIFRDEKDAEAQNASKEHAKEDGLV